MVAYFLYCASGEKDPYYGFTHDPYLDLALLSSKGYEQLFVSDLPLPVDVAAPIASDLRAKASINDTDKAGGTSRFRQLLSWVGPFRFRGGRIPSRDCPIEIRYWQKLLKSELRRRGFHLWQNVAISVIEPLESPSYQFPPDLVDSVTGLLQGRVLSYDEVRLVIGRNSLSSPYPLRDLLQALALGGRIEIWPGLVSPWPDYYTCRRCGEKSQLERIDCPLCGRDNCVICLSCRSLGEMRSCRELYHGRGVDGLGKARGFPGLKPRFAFKLTPAQAMAATKLQSYVENWINHYPGACGGNDGAPPGDSYPLESACGVDAEVLVWAVCGAGKTEIAFEALALALQGGLRVIFAIPRRDVVVELAARAKATFPEIPVTALYGGADQVESLGPLVIATTHQLLRFYEYFDLAILDEADAFPYAGSAMLYRAFRQAVKPKGLKVYMTATPEPIMLQAARRGAMRLIKIPVRHHGYPVPVPELVVDRHHLVPDSPAGQTTPTASVPLNLPPEFWAKLLRSLQEGNRVFVFVPRVWLVPVLYQVISAELGDSQNTYKAHGINQVTVLGTHSRDPNRDEKRNTFEKMAPAVMVTTSVLERGITVPRADVMVLYAQDPLYDARTLMQMSGRSGRAASYPRGWVYFIAAANTRAIQWAISSLEELNAAAEKQGFLVGSLKTGPMGKN